MTTTSDMSTVLHSNVPPATAPPATAPRSCVVVGAGVAGLACARALAARGVRVTVVDKGRGVGGRLATRRIGDAVFDHGAQSFTARFASFQQEIERWIDAEAAMAWPGLRPTGASPAESAATLRYVGAGGMTAIPKHLARGLDVRLATRIVELNEWDGGWELVSESGEQFHTECVVLTAPLPQVCALLRESRVPLPPETAALIRAVVYEPCFAVMAVLDGPSAVPPPGALVLSGSPISLISDNARKGISPVPAVTIHAGAAWTRAHLDDDAGDVARALLGAASEWLGAKVREYQLHRWLYSLPVNNVGERCLVVPGTPPLVLAGDAFGAARVEGAYLSGLAAADTVLTYEPPAANPIPPTYVTP